MKSSSLSLPVNSEFSGLKNRRNYPNKIPRFFTKKFPKKIFSEKISEKNGKIKNLAILDLSI
jgi:hypothetical protein